MKDPIKEAEKLLASMKKDRAKKEAEEKKEKELKYPDLPPLEMPKELHRDQIMKEDIKEGIITEKSFRKKWRHRLKDRMFPSKTSLIEMKHINGTLSHFFIKTKVHKFKLQGKIYIIDEDRKIYCNTSQTYMYRYHEGFSVPYEITVTSQDLKKAIPEEESIQEIRTSFNPYLLKDVLKFEYARGVIQGAEVHEFIKRSLLVGIITLVAVIVHLIIAAYKGGWF